MNNKTIRLALLSTVIIFFIFSTPFNNNWLHEKIFNENFSIFDQAEHQSIEERMEFRFGNNYNAYQAIISTLKANTNNNLKDVLLLLPPAAYTREVKVEGNFEAPEPAVFYYFTGIKSVIAKSPNVDSANWAFVVENHKMWLRKINSKQYIRDLVSIYDKYGL